jgi:DmsE family decaheme c-type cytochrome
MTCHRSKRLGLTRSGHMPLVEGGMNCADCHNPHGSTADHQIRYSTNNELCESCHADKRGPMLWEHPPVRENCLNCHEPHGSNQDKLLAGKRPFLCQRCHIGTRHPSTLYDNPDLASNRLFNRSCSNCHSQVHGSNHPSGQFLTR